eukprot:gene12990-13119_t
MWCSTVVQALSTRHRQYNSPANSAAEQAASLQQTLDQAFSGSGSCAASFAAQPLEPLSQLMNPVVFSSSFWELMHSATGLPWWASIPVTTLALRTAFLPFTLAAKSAALNFVLAQKASETARITTEGLGYIVDLTQPSVVIGTWACPYGVAGIGLPFALLVLYLKTVQQSPLAKRSERWRLFLDAGSLPYFMLSCVVPQATLLYWGANGTFYYGLNWLQQSKYAKHLGLPSAMLPLPTSRKEEKERVEMEAAEAQDLICGAQDDGFLRYLAAYYLSKGMHPQALKCLQRLTDYLRSALSVLEPAVDLAKQQDDLSSTADAWYLLAMAQTVSGLRDDALSSGQVYWSKACKNADSDPTAKSSAAAKLLPVLVNLCKRYDPQQDVEQLLKAAEFAVKVSECGWDRQSQEQLQDELGRAARAAAQHGNMAASKQLKELQSALEAVVAQQFKFRRA